MLGYGVYCGSVKMSCLGVSYRAGGVGRPVGVSDVLWQDEEFFYCVGCLWECDVTRGSRGEGSFESPRGERGGGWLWWRSAQVAHRTQVRRRW